MHTPDPNMNDELRALEARLGGWVPAVAGLDRDRVIYESGRMAGLPRRGGWVWRLATAALALVSLGLGLAWMGERGRTHELGVALASAEQRLLESQRSPAFASGAPGVERFEVLGPPDPSSYLALMVGRGASLDVPAREPESDSGASEAGSDSSLLLRYRGREGSVLLDL